MLYTHVISHLIVTCLVLPYPFLSFCSLVVNNIKLLLSIQLPFTKELPGQDTVLKALELLFDL